MMSTSSALKATAIRVIVGLMIINTSSFVQACSVQVAAGDEHTCVILDDGTVKCWGFGLFGSLGYGDTNNRGDQPGEMGTLLPTIDLGTGRTCVQLAAGASHNCALLDNANVKCWGVGSQGVLGYGNDARRGDGPGEMGDLLPAVDLGTGRTAVQISSLFAHSCAVLDDATLKCWGGGFSGRLGYGDSESLGDQPGEMGNILPAVDLGTGRTAVQVGTGVSHTCALLDDASVKCWGNGGAGRLGNEDTDDIGDDPNEMGNNLNAVELGTGRTVAQITVGAYHTCALLDDATVKCWGSGASGQLGYGNPNDRGGAFGEMGNNLPVVDLGTGRTALQISAGFDHTCAILDDASVKCWGLGSAGQLGYGDKFNRGDKSFDMGNNLPSVDLGTSRTAVQITTGSVHTCALLDDASVKCWGLGADGRLGYGDLANRGDDFGEMGDNLPAVDVSNATSSARSRSHDSHIAWLVVGTACLYFRV